MEEEEMYFFLNSASSRSRTQNKANRKKSCYTENTFFSTLFQRIYIHTRIAYTHLYSRQSTLFLNSNFYFLHFRLKYVCVVA